MRVSYNPSNYYFKLPSKLIEKDYIECKNSLPFYPNPKSPIKAVWDNETPIIIFLILSCVIFPLLPIVILASLVGGNFQSMINCYRATVKYNIQIKRFFDLIYYSNSYDEYSMLFDKEFPSIANNFFISPLDIAKKDKEAH